MYPSQAKQSEEKLSKLEHKIYALQLYFSKTMHDMYIKRLNIYLNHFKVQNFAHLGKNLIKTNI